MKNHVIAEFEDRIKDYMETRPVPSLEERYSIIEQLNEEFFQRTNGKVLPHFLLGRLTDWVLKEELTNRDIDKVTKTEFAILSHRQLRRRDRRERSFNVETVDFLNQKYTKRRDSLFKKLKKVSE